MTTWDELMAEAKRFQDMAVGEYGLSGDRKVYLLRHEFDALKRLCAKIEDENPIAEPLVHDPSTTFLAIPVVVETPEERSVRFKSYVDSYIARLTERIKANDPGMHAASTVFLDPPEPRFLKDWQAYVNISQIWDRGEPWHWTPAIDWEGTVPAPAPERHYRVSDEPVPGSEDAWTITGLPSTHSFEPRERAEHVADIYERQRLYDAQHPVIERPDAAQLDRTITHQSGRQGGKANHCPVHLMDEPCPTCTAYIAGGL